MRKMVKLGEICDVLDSLRKAITKKDRVAGDYPYYGATGIVDWVEDYIFDEKLVLVGEDGAKWGSGDTTAFIATGKYWVNNHAHVLRPMPELVIHEWISYYLTGIDLSEFVTGLTVPKLNQANLRTIPIPLPPLAEQQRIVAKLDAASAEIEKAKNSLEQERVRYRNFVKAAILSKLEGIDKLHVSDFEQVCDFVRGPFGGSLKKSMFVEKGFAVYEQQHPINDQFDDFRYFITDEKFSEMERFAVQPGDVLMSCSGSLGKTGIVPSSAPKGIINQALLKITPKENILAEYLQLVMRSDLFQSLIWDVSGGAAQSNVPPIKVIKKLPLPVPPVAEQKEILSWAHELMGANLEIILDQKLKAFVQLKSAILAQELQSEAA